MYLFKLHLKTPAYHVNDANCISDETCLFQFLFDDSVRVKCPSFFIEALLLTICVTFPQEVIGFQRAQSEEQSLLAIVRIICVICVHVCTMHEWLSVNMPNEILCMGVYVCE